MRLNLTKRASGDIPYGLIYGTIALLALVAVRFLPVQNVFPSCAFKAFTGVPCPTCGTTRLLMHLSQGDLFGALSLNPAVALAIVAALLLIVYDAAALYSGSRVVCSLTQREAVWIRSGTAAALLANWFYLTASL
jgi:hypothetical protein